MDVRHFWKHDFEIKRDPKSPPSGSNFDRVLRPQTLRDRAIFWATKKSKIANKAQAGICILSSQAKKRMPLYGIICISENFWPITWPNINIFHA